MKDFKLRDILISILIVSVTLLYFLDTYIMPQDLKTIDIMGFEIGSFGFNTIFSLVHYSKMKLLILSFATIWYFTCKHWYKPSILVIIFIELLKITTMLNPNRTNFDEIEYYLSLPITIPIIIILILISNKIDSLNTYKKIQFKIDDEINNELLILNANNQKEINDLESKFKILIKQKKEMDNDEYLSQLILIREKIFNKE
ncbi:hypothetical protein [Psychroserpens sp.]